MTINRNSNLRQLGGIKGFYLGQLEGQTLRNIGACCTDPDRIEDVIQATIAFDFTTKIANNYKVILAHKDDAKYIADFLCGLNWLGMFYSRFYNERRDPRYQSVLRDFYLLDEIEYFAEAGDFYYFAYDYLLHRFYDDKTIDDAIKSEVIRIND